VDGQLRLMAVHAHPDDESSKGASTMAMYAERGVDVMVVTCTGGERGSVLNPNLDRPEVLSDIARLRRLEMARASRILGVRHEWLGFVDSGLPDGDVPAPLPPGCFARQDVSRAAGRLVRLVRSFRPHVLLTYDEEGGYPHPDHVMTHRISMAAFDTAGDAGRHPALGRPWQPLKLYYHVETRAERLAQHEGMLAAGFASPFTDTLPELLRAPCRDGRVTTRITCPDYFRVRDDALRAHTTQIDPDGEWFQVPLTVRQQAWPTEEFELARTLVGHSAREDDLFAGIRELAGV
jgi:mycothiol S-conjugate amidase